MEGEFQVTGKNAAAPFTLRVHRGEGMALLAMNWRGGQPPDDFVGFCIEYREPGSDRFWSLTNRLGFASADGTAAKGTKTSRESPFQTFRWVHFPRNAELNGGHHYRVTPVYMNEHDELFYGHAPQEVTIDLRRETYPGQLNVTFTRGFVSSQAFVDFYEAAGPIATLLPASADDGPSFTPTHPKAEAALAWMGFEARSALYELLDQAISDPTAEVRVVAYDLNERGFVERLERLGGRLKIIVDDSGSHGKPSSGETQSAARLAVSAGVSNVRRQHMSGLEHNKFIVVTGAVNRAVGGSTNFSWRGFYVQANNAVFVTGKDAIQPFLDAFEGYWAVQSGDPDYNDRVRDFTRSPLAAWQALRLPGINAKIAFSPHAQSNALLGSIAADIKTTKSSLFYSLAFLYQTPGVILDAINAVSSTDCFVYGMSDRSTGGIVLTKPGSNPAPVYPSALSKNLPAPFKEEPTGGGGVRLHHKFVVIDFDTPEARVYFGSYNFSIAADRKNGENLFCIQDRRVATAYMVEAVRIFDHYSFRLTQQDAKRAKKQLVLARPPRAPDEQPWWKRYYTDPQRVRDRNLFGEP